MNLRNIPSVNKILINKKIENLRINKVILKDIINKELEDLRKNSNNKNGEISEKQIIDNIVQNVETLKKLKFSKVINGTGVLLHTNLGRSPISKKSINNGLKKTIWPGRLEKGYLKNIPVFLDGAHNVAGSEQIVKFFKNNSINRWLVIGMLNNKDLKNYGWLANEMKAASNFIPPSSWNKNKIQIRWH